ncbi:MAG: hypothetical protein PHC97_00610 [Patescibacteria group bacterium]|nr:hypothetical protein [Patescibacteria group bacterium]
MLIPIAILFLAVICLVLLAFLGYYIISLYGLIILLLVTIAYGLLSLLEGYRVIILGRAPFIRSSKKIIRLILQGVDFKKGATVCELGCGDGRFLRELARNRDVSCFGYEYSLPPYLLGRLYNYFSRKKVKIYFKDFFKADLSGVDYIFCYLMPKEMIELEKKIRRELKPGSLIISNTFIFRGWQPIKVIKGSSPAALNSNVYIYRT